jgi:hypothetical protein
MSDVAITFGGDTGKLEASVVVAKAQVNGLAHQPRSDLQGLGVFNRPAIERRGRFCGQSRCDDKGDKRPLA